MISNRAKFVDFKKLKNTLSINIVDDSTISAVDVETIALNAILASETVQTVTLRDVFYVFALSVRLLSTTQIITHDDTIFFDENECVIQNKKTENVIFRVIKCRSSYSLNLTRKIEIYTTNAIQFEQVMTINDDAINF